MPLPDVIPFIGLGWSDVLFLILSGVVLAAAFAVVFGRDIIKSGLFLILTLGALAGIYVMLGAAIVAGAQVLVYIGAISVLILFAIMLTQSKLAGEAGVPNAGCTRRPCGGAPCCALRSRLRQHRVGLHRFR